ncbi:MAG: cytochrome C [Leptospirillia bacterium]
MRWLVLSLLGVFAFASAAPAASIESLVMPGQVIEGHAEYEEDCSSCHRRFSKGSQRDLCLDCHEEVAADVKAKEGFHGRRARVAEAECRDCHPDHLGRDADVIQLDPETFEHADTDFALEGAHRKARCERCHKPDVAFREAPSACFSCHEEDDIHEGRLGEKCGTCHDESRWAATTAFDHDKTDFPLKGAHKEVTCAFCHPNERYKDIPDRCISCHRLNDEHGGRYGDKCEDCHTPEEWEKTVFDHDKDTDYPLVGHHADVACDVCHTGKLSDELETTCITCHKSDDTHKGKYGKECETCHVPKDWDKVDFDHDKDTDFILKGRHIKTECNACHKGDLYGEALKDATCHSCHRKDDVHRGEQGKQCDRCHNETGWAADVVFDHDLTRFPLIGLHATVPCEACHVSRPFSKTERVCGKCHEADDVHKRRLGPVCGDCHNPNAWTLWTFDHDTQTDFILDGAHEGLDCHACHRKPTKKRVRVSSACGHCHGQDDVHNEEFGRRCGRCHNTEAFDQITVGR